MTVFHEEDDNNVVANNADRFAHFDEDGRLIIDCDSMSRGVRKMEEFVSAFEKAAEANQE